MVTSQIFQNLLTRSEIADIIEFYETQPFFNTESDIRNKNLEYHLTDNYMYQLLYPKMCAIFGPDHIFDTGTYKSSRSPYIIHVDSRAQHDQYDHCMSFGTGRIKHNKAVLIPLVEGDQYRTITFQAWSDHNPSVADLQSHATEKNHLDPADFGHDANFSLIQDLAVDTDYHWRLGDVLIWDRNQWHMASDFWRFGKEKNFLVLFIE